MGANAGSGGQMAGRMQNMMRERALQRQEMTAPPMGMETPLETSAPQGAPGLEAQPQPSPMDQGSYQEGQGRGMDRGPRDGSGMGRGRSGIVFGPGRASRLPEQGSPEYEQLLQRVRGLAQMK
jgi:hypothetical protein